jgi:phage gp36-like protein
MFLSQNELKTVADKAIIVLITDMDEEIVDQVIAESIDLMSSYLSRYYDVQNIFNKQGVARNLTVLKYLKDIVIYEVYMRHTRQINEAAQKRYNEAMNFLEKLNTGDFFISTLPSIPGEITSPNNQEEQQTRFGSNSPYQTMY